MDSKYLEKILFRIVQIGAYVLPFFLLVLINHLFFPFITGKNFLFRITVEIMLAAWVGLLFIDFKKYWPRWNFVGIAFIIFISAAFLSAIFGADFKNSFWSNFERMDGLITHLHLLFLFLILAGTFRTRREWFILFGVSISASILLAAYGLLEYGGAITIFANQGSSRIMSTLGNPLYVAAYLTFNIFLILFFWLSVRSAVFKWILGILFLFELTAFFLTGSRGAFLGILAGAGIIFLLWLLITKGAKKKITLASAIIILALIPILLNIFRDVSFIKNNGVISRFSSISLSATTVRSRFTIWGMAFKSFKERPILGWGFGNFIIPFAKNYNPEMYGNEPWFDRTHNMPVEWLVSGGIVGFLAYLALFISSVWALARSVKNGLIKKNISLIFIGMLAAYFVQICFVFDTLSTYLMLVLMLGFFSVVSSSADEEWSKNNSLDTPAPVILPEIHSSGKKLRRELRRLKKLEQKNLTSFSLSSFRKIGIIGAFIMALIFIITINVRPLKAAGVLIDAFSALSQQKYVEAEENFKKALSLSNHTIGTEEIREHLAMNMLGVLSQLDLLKDPEIKSLYQFAISEMEKQVEENPKKDLKIKHNILLAQLYGGLGIFERNSELVRKSINQYQLSIQFAPNYFHLYPVMAGLLARIGYYGEAITAIKKSEDILTSVQVYDSNIFYTEPLLYAATKEYDQAYEALQRLTAHGSPERPLDPERTRNILNIVRSGGKDALPFLEKVYLLDKSNTDITLLLAQMHAEAGNTERAQFYADEILKQDPLFKDKVSDFLKTLDKKSQEKE